jgi:hypothetical protein
MRAFGRLRVGAAVVLAVSIADRIAHVHGGGARQRPVNPDSLRVAVAEVVRAAASLAVPSSFIVIVPVVVLLLLTVPTKLPSGALALPDTFFSEEK